MSVGVGVHTPWGLKEEQIIEVYREAPEATERSGVQVFSGCYLLGMGYGGGNHGDLIKGLSDIRRS